LHVQKNSTLVSEHGLALASDDTLTTLAFEDGFA